MKTGMNHLYTTEAEALRLAQLLARPDRLELLLHLNRAVHEPVMEAIDGRPELPGMEAINFHPGRPGGLRTVSDEQNPPHEVSHKEAHKTQNEY